MRQVLNAVIIAALLTIFNFEELSCLKAATNIALGKRTSQSSLFNDNPDYGSFKGVDSGESDESAFSTKEESNPWWEVDLGASYPINSITLYNILGEENYRVKGMQIWISQNGMDYSLIYVHDSYVFRNRRADIGGHEARYIRLTIPGYSRLTLQEVVVYLYGTVEPPAKEPLF